jgi:hypothetical protein
MQMQLKALVAVQVVTTALAFFSSECLRAIACSGNVCWHVTQQSDITTAAAAVKYRDWRPAVSGITFRGEDGHGYCKSDIWASW